MGADIKIHLHNRLVKITVRNPNRKINNLSYVVWDKKNTAGLQRFENYTEFTRFTGFTKIGKLSLMMVDSLEKQIHS